MQLHHLSLSGNNSEITYSMLGVDDPYINVDVMFVYYYESRYKMVNILPALHIVIVIFLEYVI